MDRGSRRKTLTLCFCVDITATPVRRNHRGNNRCSCNVHLVEPRRVELLSEDPSTRLSTSVADALAFPPSGPQRQGQDFSSFIRSHLRQSLCRLVPHLDDARDPGRGQPGTDGHCLSSDGYEIRFVSCFLISRF